MENLNPHLNYIAVTNYLPNKDFVKAYDCRFFFVLSGKGSLLTESGNFPLSENTLAYYPSGTPYFLKSSAEYPLFFVTMNFDFTRTYPPRIAPFRPVSPDEFKESKSRPSQNELSAELFKGAFTLEHAFSLREDFVSLSELFGKDEPYSDEICSALLKYIILKILNHATRAERESKATDKVIDYINRNFTERLDNNTLAARFGYHPYYLSSLFKSQTGKTLHRYVLEARLKFGCDLLLRTDLAISEISAKCGFANANHFSVKFKNQYGISPSEWRSMNSII